MKNKPKTNSQQGTGIKCPSCKEATRVKNSVPKPEKGIHGRYRECLKCGLRIYTEETIKYVVTK